MQIDIFFASKYGATQTISELIKTKLDQEEKFTVSLFDMEKQKNVNNAYLNILLSPIYGGLSLKAFDNFLINNKKQLQKSNIIVFAVALSRKSCFDEKHLKIVKNHQALLKHIIHQDALLGKRVFDNLAQEDKQKLIYFYKNILNLDQQDIKEKKKPINLIDENAIFQSLQKALKR